MQTPQTASVYVKPAKRWNLWIAHYDAVRHCHLNTRSNVVKFYTQIDFLSFCAYVSNPQQSAVITRERPPTWFWLLAGVVGNDITDCVEIASLIKQRPRSIYRLNGHSFRGERSMPSEVAHFYMETILIYKIGIFGPQKAPVKI